jgi:hypothetical protein
MVKVPTSGSQDRCGRCGARVSGDKHLGPPDGVEGEQGGEVGFADLAEHDYHQQCGCDCQHQHMPEATW